MSMSHPRNPIRFIGAVLVPIAALAAETSAQSRDASPSLSAAIAEVLQSPFHVGASRTDAVVMRSPVQSLTLPVAWWEAGRFETPLFRSGPDAQVPPSRVAPSRGKMIANSMMGALVGHGFMYALLWCDTSAPGRFTGPLSSGVGGPAGGTQASCNEIGPLRTIVGILTPVATTSGFAYLVGRRAKRALVGSALGFGVWLGSVAAVISVDYENELLLAGFGPIIHGLVAGLVAR